MRMPSDAVAKRGHSAYLGSQVTACLAGSHRDKKALFSLSNPVNECNGDVTPTDQGQQGEEKLSYQHLTAKSFRIPNHVLPIVEENAIDGAHIDAMNMAKIAENIVLDCNRVGVLLCDP